MEFVNDGGYLNEELWSASGWKWRSFRGATLVVMIIFSVDIKNGFRFNLLLDVFSIYSYTT